MTHRSPHSSFALGLAAAAVTCALGLTARGADPDFSPSFEKDVRPVIVENCMSCHNAEKKKGDFDLSPFETAEKAIADEEAWQSVAERLRDKDMPPKKAKRRPTDHQREVILAWVEKHIAPVSASCNQIATDKNQKFYRGYAMSRRLTRAEYANTVRDLVGIDLDLADMLPVDGSGGEGFDTDGDALFTSAISIEKYLKAADLVMRAALPDLGTPQSEGARLARERLLVVVPDAELPERAAARQVIAAFASRAFRRPAIDAEVDRFLQLLDRAKQRGDSYESSVRLALKGVLVSPSFLFLVEPEPEQDGVYQLGDYPLASRLSYFLWSSMPDDELMALSAAGRLHDESVLRQQVRRMLKDPRAIALSENFGSQWLGVTALGVSTRPDATRFPQFDDGLRDAERREVVLFLNSVMTGDRSLLDLIDADYTFANDKLAALYGLPKVSGTELKRVALPDHTRGGVLGMAAILTSTSYPLRTSPVLRGKWVLEQLLGEKIPPPPPTAGQLPPDDHQSDGLTFRKRLEAHRSNPECASCHSKMDPIGFGLENFDAIGRWRTTQLDQPVDSTGVLPDGQTFAGPKGLKEVLLRRKVQFLYNFSRKMLGYALGRSLNRFDECVIKECVKQLEANGDKPGALMETIVVSAPFQYRYAKR